MLKEIAASTIDPFQVKDSVIHRDKANLETAGHLLHAQRLNNHFQ